MKKLSAIAIGSMMFVGLMLGSSISLGQDECRGGGQHVIQVRPVEGGPPELSYRGGSAEEVHVCIGDNVRWVLTGPQRQFFVEFLADLPYDGERRLGSNDNVVSVTIGGPAQRGQGYDYGVEMANGPAMDPRIVVD